MKWTWNKAANYCEEMFGIQVEREDEAEDCFFVCPECGEPLYACDFPDDYDWSVCPVCESEFKELD